MKKILSSFLFFSITFCFGQFNSIAFKKELNQVKLKTSLNTILKESEIDEESNNEVTKILSKKNDKQKEFISRVYSPLENLKINSSYGVRFHPIEKRLKFHSGIDFHANKDTVRSVLKGIVLDAGYNSGLGNYLKIKHNDYTSIYAHLREYFFLKGEYVKDGEKIGVTGNTGRSTGEHLHFEIEKNGKKINPLLFLKKLILLNNREMEKQKKEVELLREINEEFSEIELNKKQVDDLNIFYAMDDQEILKTDSDE